ncbi:hypothetical protein F5X99DRAFT_404756 [Biscogniauxia marginata]|nr:hypothetical protein F5X99DRAFT_404756 [Biscogniauxia marginata]
MPPAPGTFWDLLERRDAPPIKRRTSHAKTRTGCVTCKGRRVKCDEARPSCAKCEKAGFQCAGYEKPPKDKRRSTLSVLATNKKVSDAPLRPKPLQRGVVPEVGLRLVDLPVTSMTPAYISLEDILYFDRFRYQVILEISVWCGTDYWKHILRVVMHDECLRHAILAASAMLLAIEESGEPSRGHLAPSAHGKRAFHHYMKAISLCRKKLKGGMTTEIAPTSLAATFFFSLIESLQGNIANADLILAQGVLLLDEALARKGPDGLPAVKMSRELADIKSGFQRLNITLGLCPFFQGHEEIYKTMTPTYQTDIPDADSSLLLLQACWDNFHRDIGLFMLTVRCGILITPEQMSLAILQQSKYLALLENWRPVLDTFLEKEKNSVTSYLLTKMKAYSLVAKIFLRCFTDRSDLLYDEQLEGFQEVLKICQKFVPEKPLLDLDLFPIVSFTVTKCRDQKTRQLALKTFTEMTYRQAFWNNQGLLKALRALVDLEDQGRDSSGFIPADSRYLFVGSDWDQDRRQMMATFICAISVPTESGDFPTVRVPIDF